MPKERAKKKWLMPKWMEPYRNLINNTGGNPIEELMNDTTTNGQNNVIRAALIIAVDSQITLLFQLKKKGFLIRPCVGGCGYVGVCGCGTGFEIGKEEK